MQKDRDSHKNYFFSRHRWPLTLCLIFLIGAIVIWFYSQPTPIAVDISTVGRGLVEQTVANTRAGTVKACRRAKLSPSVGGQITELPIKEGDEVKQGQLLLSLWNEDLVAQVKLVNNEIRAAQNNANSVCLLSEFSRREADRLEKLYEKNAVSEELFDDAMTVKKMHSSNCQSAKASIDMRKAQLSVAQALLAKTRLVAPFDGVIADISAELSEYVTPSPVGVQTLPAIDLINNQCFYVAAPIDEVDMPAISVGLPTRITLDAFGDEVFQGTVRRIASYVLDLEKQARTVDVEVTFIQKEDYQTLLAGYSADVEIILNANKNTLRIPSEAIMFDDNSAHNSKDLHAEKKEKKKVWLYQPETQTIISQEIETGLSNWSYTEVIDGLTEGDKIVLSIDREGLANNSKVLVTEKTPRGTP